jgi:hypothetical protein
MRANWAETLLPPSACSVSPRTVQSRHYRRPAAGRDAHRADTGHGGGAVQQPGRAARDAAAGAGRPPALRMAARPAARSSPGPPPVSPRWRRWPSSPSSRRSSPLPARS